MCVLFEGGLVFIFYLLHPPLHVIKLLCKPLSSTSSSTTMGATMLLLLKYIVKGD